MHPLRRPGAAPLHYLPEVPPELLAFDLRLGAVWAAVQVRMAQDGAHDTGHLARVARWAVRLAPETPALAVAAALTHDLVNLPVNHPERARASELSATQARELLRVCGFTEAEADAVALAVRDHSFSRGAAPETPLAAALQDADRLDALGALGVLRAATVGGALGRPLLDAGDPWAERRPLDDARFTLDHFFTKLLRLPEGFHTAAGRLEAERRARAMRDFLGELGLELSAGGPPN